mgnify:CR=1 FL=1|jgi:nicotinate-nucleotide adenylyltransferase
MDSQNVNKILVFGGSFNPITVGHNSIVSTLQKAYPGLPIWIMPSGDRRDKSIEADFVHRSNMVKLFLKEFGLENNVSVNEIENTYGPPTSTIETLELLFASGLPIKTEFLWVCGSDSFNSLTNWYQYERLKEMVTWVVLDRPGIKITHAEKKMDIIPQIIEPVQISSSEIRENLHDALFCKKYVGEAVYDYIRTNNLY